MATQTIKGIEHITVECSNCGERERFFGANMREVYAREEEAGWQHDPTRKLNAREYLGTCDPCSELPLGSD